MKFDIDPNKEWRFNYVEVYPSNDQHFAVVKIHVESVHGCEQGWFNMAVMDFMRIISTTHAELARHAANATGVFSRTDSPM